MDRTELGEAAREAAVQSKSFLTRMLDRRATQAGERVGATADDLRRIGEQLSATTGVSGAATLATRGADTLERVGRYLRESDGDALIRDVENFTRRRPWTVAGVALVSGFAASRLLKSSSLRRYASDWGDSYAS